MIVTAAEDIELFRKAGKLAGEVLEELGRMVKPGISTWDLDQTAESMIRDGGGIPTFKGYRNFPASICASVNDEIVHGIPNKKKLLKEGDIISLDIGVTLRVVGEDGKKHDYIGDTAITVPVGSISARVEKLLTDTQASLYAGIAAARNGANLDEVGGAIEDIAKQGHYGLVREYGGHGIGPRLHEEPFIFNYRNGSRTHLKAGMVIAIEPMFNLGGGRTKQLADGWTVVTTDYKPSAHFEHSILITQEADPEILTRRPSEKI